MRTIGTVVLVAMLLSLGHGFAAGDLGREGGVLLDLAWGRVSLVDIYTGVFVFGAWIVWREGSILRAMPWLVILALLGNFGVAPYLLWISRAGHSVADALTGGR
jgi:hypothetical protein